MAEDNSSQEQASNEGSSQNTTHQDAEALQSEVQKWKNEYLYLRAEFDNYKKNALKERSELLKYGSERIVRDILEVMDNFERALSMEIKADNIGPFKTGIEMTAKELKEALNKNGIQEIASEGQPFNPVHHEAISSEPTDAVQEGHVSRVFKKPYKLHDKIIRMGQVVVATTPPKTEA